MTPGQRARQVSACVFLVVLPMISAAQGIGSVAGRVTDSVTSERLGAASVSVVGTRTGTFTDTLGRFRLDQIPAGTVVLRTRRVGYADRIDTVSIAPLATLEIDLRLVSAVIRLGAVRSEARAAEREIFESKPNIGVMTVSGKMISTVPRLGEADVLRAAQLLPGVQARNDFTAGLNVRGGEADQNLVLMDGYPIFNPFHFGGLFGTFIDAAVDDLQLLTGGFPARYGGRLSSVLDVRSAEESRTGIHGSSTVSLLASNAVLGGAFPAAKGSWLVAGRRTYADKVFKALGKDVLPYYFRDVQSHSVYRPNPNTSISITAYNGRDDIDAVDPQSDQSFKFWWGNTVAGTTIEATLPEGRVPLLGVDLGESAALEQRVSITRFGTGLNVSSGTLALDNSVRELRVGGDVRWAVGTHRRSVGYEITRDDLRYDVTSNQSDAAFYHRDQALTGLSAYYEDLWRVAPRVMLQIGARGEQLSGEGWRAISPRVSGKWFVTNDVAVTGAVGRYSQWLHSLAREDIPVRLFDFWMGSNRSAPVSRAWHYVLGSEAWLSSQRFVRVEAYAKTYQSLLEPNPAPDPLRGGTDFLEAKGTSYGFDVLVRQLERERWGGWIAYSYGFNRREQKGRSYYPGQDRRNNLNLVATYRPSSRYVLSGRFGYASGTPYTDIVGEIARHGYNIRSGEWTSTGEEDLQPLGGTRNANRLPDTQRLDLSVTRDFGKGTTITPFFSLINAYNARNVFMYVFDYESKPPTRTAFSQLPLVPSFGITVTF